MSPRFRSSFAAPTGFVAAVTRIKPAVAPVTRLPTARVPFAPKAANDRQPSQRAA